MQHSDFKSGQRVIALNKISIGEEDCAQTILINKGDPLIVQQIKPESYYPLAVSHIHTPGTLIYVDMYEVKITDSSRYNENQPMIIKLLIGLPVERKHGAVKGRKFKIQRYENGKAYFISDANEEIVALPHEFQLV